MTLKKGKWSLLRFLHRVIHPMVYEAVEDLKVNIYLYEKGKKVGEKPGVPYIPASGTVVEVEENGRLFMVETVFISHSFGVVHLYGYIMEGWTRKRLHES